MIRQTENAKNGFFESVADARSANALKGKTAETTSANEKENFKETFNSITNAETKTQENGAAKSFEQKIAKYIPTTKTEVEGIVDAQAAKFAVEVENVNSSVVETNLINAQDFGFDMKMNAVENIEEVLRSVSELLNLDIDTNLPMVNFDVEEMPREVIEQLAELLVIFKDISDAFLETGIKNENLENRGNVYNPEQAIATGQYLQQETLKLELSFAELGITEEVAQEAMKISPKIEANTGLHFAADLEKKTPAQQILPKSLESILSQENVKSETGEIKNVVERLKEAMSTVQNSSAKVETENAENTNTINKANENAVKAPVIDALNGLKKEIAKEVKSEIKSEIKETPKTEIKEAKIAVETTENKEVAKEKAEKAEIKTEVKVNVENKEIAKEKSVNAEIKTEKEVAKEAANEIAKESAKKSEIKETGKAKAKTEAKTEVKSETKVEVKSETKTEIKTEVKTATKTETKVEVKTETKSETKTAANTVAKTEIKTEVKSTSTLENSETMAKTKTETKVSAEVKSDVKSAEVPETKASAKKHYAKNEAQAQAKANDVLNNEFVSPIKDSIIRSTEANIASPIALDGVSIEASKFSDASEIQSVSPRFIKLFEKEIIEQVQKTILSTANKNGSHQISLTLNPEKLGEVKLTIQVDGNVVSAKINVENLQVKNIIEQNLQQLKEALDKQNLSAGSLDVNVGENEARDLQEKLHNAKIRAQNKTGFNGEEGVMTDESQFELGVDTGRRYGTNSFEFFA
ncbi:MAG: flagellar hook-length control protein FliK [Chitinivibrionia bacterium]|nr:flagellar hook-length control protein FliK [Chitinivibrionia bacterium]